MNTRQQGSNRDINKTGVEKEKVSIIRKEITIGKEATSHESILRRKTIIASMFIHDSTRAGTH